MPVVAISGYRNSGKTTLVERLVESLSTRGRVATVKSIHHDVDVDTPGKDTHRHRAAGADAVVGLTPTLSFQIRVDGTERDRDPDESLDRGLELLGEGYDYVLAEGFKSVAIPTILVGDIDEDAVAGQILARVQNPDDVDTAPLIEAIDAVPDDR